MVPECRNLPRMPGSRSYGGTSARGFAAAVRLTLVMSALPPRDYRAGACCRGLVWQTTALKVIRHCRRCQACTRLSRLRPSSQMPSVDMIAKDPECGVLVPGAGGIRKVRFGFGGRGKRGGARVIYLFGGRDIPLFLLAAFAKNEQADLSSTERSALSRQVVAMVSRYRRRK